MPTAEVIKVLSPVIRGWCNYFRYAVAKRTFAKLDHHIWRITYKWAKRRHPRKNRRWVVNHYYGVDQGRGWDLWDGRNRLPRHNETRVSRFVKVRGKANPFDPSLRDYWEDRRTRRLVREASHFHRIHLLQRQAGRCAACKAVFDPDLEQGRQHQRRDAPQLRHRRDDPCSRPPLVPSRTVPAVGLVCAGRCLSRMRGNLHVRF